jgi:poly(A) polymerase
MRISDYRHNGSEHSNCQVFWRAGVKKDHQRLAESIVSALQEAQFTAFFAGGWVRDFVMGKPCQDIDIATSAHPEQVMSLFPRSVAVGAQFGVVRVLLGAQEFEVATFRSDAQYIDGRRPSRVDLHTSPEEDAKRRDFTINGMFYDPISHELYDYVGGKEDIDNKIIRTIGCPQDRFKEDRLRMIRAIRFKNVLGFSVDPDAWEAICQECHHVPSSVSPERVWQELHKMFATGVLPSCLRDMASCGLLAAIFPVLKKAPSHTIKERLAMIAKYSGRSLAAGLCLLFQGDEAAYLSQFAEDYRLSKKEKKIIDLFLQYDGLHTQLSDPKMVKLYAKAECADYLAAAATLRENPNRFIQRHLQHQEELFFWIEQVRTKTFLITGEDLKARGVSPGAKMGQLLEQAFEESVTFRLKDKKQLLDRICTQS